MDVIMGDTSAAANVPHAAPTSFYLLNISNKLGAEYVHMFDDFLRMVAIQTTLQLMVFLSNPSENAFLSADFVLLLIYILIGLSLYWLVLRKLVMFK
jgi:hypothetical protein